MPLITCSDCGREISNRAPACPHCGCPTQGTNIPTVPPVSGRSSPTLVPPVVSPAGIPSLAASRSSRWHDPPIYRAAIGLIGGVAAWLLAEVIGSGYEPANRTNEGGMWLAVLTVATLFAVSLSVADYLIARNWRRAALGSIFAFGLAIVGMCSGMVACFLDPLMRAAGSSSQETLEQAWTQLTGARLVVPLVLFSAGFALFATMTPAIILRSWKRLWIGFAGGFVGILSGGGIATGISYCLWISIGPGSALLHAMLATAIILPSTFAGFVTGLVENVVKTGWLRVISGKIAGRQVILYRNSTCIGSSPKSEVYLCDDPLVAPQHAAIHSVNGAFEVEDLQSPTGTFVNGQRISRTVLRDNDQVKIGATDFQFHQRSR